MPKRCIFKGFSPLTSHTFAGVFLLSHARHPKYNILCLTVFITISVPNSFLYYDKHKNQFRGISNVPTATGVCFAATNQNSIIYALKKCR